MDTNLSAHFRTHHDFDKGNAALTQQFTKSAQFYQDLGTRLVTCGHCVDLFACSLDQVGVAEMFPMVEGTGGQIVLSESYQHHVFRESIKKIFERDNATGDMKAALKVELECRCSHEIKVCGMIGPAASADKPSPLVSDMEIGCGNTVRWKAGTANKHSSYAFYFDVVVQHTTQESPSLKHFYLQFVTEYAHANGRRAIRAVTVCRPWAVPASPTLALGFDQEAAACLIAKMASSRAEEGQDVIDIIRWLDRMLVALANRFGQYNEGRPESFRLPAHMSQYPEFMYHLRRSQVLQVFNNSPDETVFFR